MNNNNKKLIRELQIKTTRYKHTPTGVTKSRASAGKDVGQQGLLSIAAGTQRGAAPMGGSGAAAYRTECSLTSDPAP